MGQNASLKEIFRQNLTRLRVEQGLKQVDLARKTKISTRYMSELENNCKNVTLDTVETLAEALNVRPAELLFPKHFNQKQLDALELAKELIEQQIVFLSRGS